MGAPTLLPTTQVWGTLTISGLSSMVAGIGYITLEYDLV